MISFVCPFCAKGFQVHESLAGKTLTCSACGGTVAVPGTPPPPPIRPMPARPEEYAPSPPPPPPPPQFDPSRIVEEANRSSWYALVAGLLSIVPICNCVTLLVTIIFGIKTLSKSGADAALLKPAKSRAILGIVLGIALTVVVWIAMIWLASVADKERKKDIEMADRAYAEKRWSDAKPLYEKHKDATDGDDKAKCNARLGRIRYAEGDKSGAREAFEAVAKVRPEYKFECEDPEVVKFFQKTVRAYLRSNGQLGFPVSVVGSRKDDVSISQWRIEGKSIVFEARYKVSPNKLRINVILSGEGDKTLSDYYCERDTSDSSKPVKWTSPEFEEDWDDVRKATVYVEPK